MAINKNHEFEDLDSIKCAIVEKNASGERVQFLKSLLETNHYQVVVVNSPEPKVSAVVVSAPAVEGEPMKPSPIPEAPVVASTFTIGVTDLAFNAINAIFGRALKTMDGHIVTLAYWQQKDTFSNDEIPYFNHRTHQQ